MAQSISTALAGFQARLVNTIESMSFSDCNNIDEDTQDIWSSSTITWPRLLKSEDCWTDSAPSVSKLILDTLDAIATPKDPSEFTVHRRGEQDLKIDPRTAITQLIEPKQSNPVMIIGLPILEPGVLGTPLALCEWAETFDISNEQMLLTPKYTHTDLHIDTADGLSLPVGQCVKIWFCYPPTQRNLNLMSKADCQKAKLVRIGKKLEGGIMYTTTSDHAIWLPASTIHTVFTLQGGFLAAIDFNTPYSSRPLGALMAASVDRLAGPNFKKEIFGRFADSLDLGLCNNQEEIALGSWIQGLESIVDHSKIEPAFHAQVTQIWYSFFSKGDHKDVVCPCGEQGDLSLQRHFETCHMEVKVKEKKVPDERRETRLSRKRKADEMEETEMRAREKAGKTIKVERIDD